MKDFTSNLPRLTQATTKVDYSRINKEIEAQVKRLDEMRRFLIQRGDKLTAALSAINALLANNKMGEPVYNNTYSTHWDKEEYTEVAAMLLGCQVVMKGEVKNQPLFKQRFEEKWHATISAVYGISLDRISLHGDGKTAELKIRVRP